MSEFRMPSLGADMTEGTLLEWLVGPGDVVHRGDIIAVVDTSKSAIDIEVFEDGRIDRLLVEPGTTVDVGTPLAILSGGAERTEDRLETPADQHGTRPHATAAPPSRQLPVSPLARRRARELGVELSAVSGTGQAGAITVADVEAAGSDRTASGEQSGSDRAGTSVDRGASQDERASAMRRSIGALMARSKKEIPHYYLQQTIDVDAALSWLEQANAQRPLPDRILPAALLLKATALAARAVPEVNGFFADHFEPAGHVHLGVAVSLRGGGLIAPALHDADQLSLEDLMASLKDLVARARGGRLRSSEMSDPTMTVTNLGDQGVEAVFGAIYPPQVALVGFGRIDDQPRAVEGMLTVRRCVVATLSADHRVSDGHRGGLFLAALDAAIQRPEEL